MRRPLWVLFAVILSQLILPQDAPARDVGREFISVDHWSYTALGRFEALRLVDLPSERPFTRTEVSRYAERIQLAVRARAIVLSDRDRFELDRLIAEFSSVEARSNPRQRWDRAVFFVEEEPFAFDGDIDVSLIPRQAPFDSEVDFFVASNPELRLHIGPWVTYEVSYKLLFGPEKGDRARDEKPTPRTRSFKGLTTLYERAYLVYQWRRAVLFWGRDYVDWGPSMQGNLLVSSTAQSLDKFGGRFGFKALRMSFFQAKMNGEFDRYLAGHRLELQLWDLVFGLAETAVYEGRGFDPLYMLPFSWFYANQFSERDDDNIIWSMDVKYRAPAGLLFWASVLIDDAQFERDGTAPDKIGVDVGGRYALGGPLPMTFETQYRYVDIYTYTHRDTLTYHVTQLARPNEGDPPIGVALGPDADSFFGRVAVFPVPRLTTRLGVNYARRGEGNDWRKHTPDLDPFPPFPSGVVEKTTAVTLSALWEFRDNHQASFAVTQTRVENHANVQREDVSTTSFDIRLIWDF